MRYLALQTVVVNVVRALLPQRPEALTSYFGYNRSLYASVGAFRAFVWVLRDVLVWAQMAVVLLSIALRWLASRTAFVANRTKVIASGGEDTLASFLFSMACSSLFFGGAAIAGLAVFEPVMLFEDYNHHGSLFLSFYLCKATRVDVFMFSLFFFLALGSAAEHLSRREIIHEGILCQTQIGKRITLCFRLKRQVSVVSTLAWVALFFVRKEGDAVLLAVRIVAAVSVGALLSLHTIASYFGLAHLFRTIQVLDSNLSLQFKFNGVVPSFLLRWIPREEPTASASTVRDVVTAAAKVSASGNASADAFTVSGGRRGTGGGSVRDVVRDLLRVARNFYPIMLWHVSGRTIAAQIAMFISLCNWLPLVPGVQVVLYTCVASFTVAALGLFHLCNRMNPACLNTSGDEIPTAHVGFGMLVIKVQLLGCGGGSSSGADYTLKMVPASIERLFEAVTISYRWDPAVSFPVRVWHRQQPMTVQFRIELLRRAFELTAQRRMRFGDHTLIWFDQASIDQESDRFKALLVPRMTACYALSVLTLVLDNTDTYAFGTPDNYYSRIWTFQEYCIPPAIVVFTSSPLATPAPVEANRRLIQQRYWNSHTSSRRSKCYPKAPNVQEPANGSQCTVHIGQAAVLKASGRQGAEGQQPSGQGHRQQPQQEQLFLVVGFDTPDTIQRWLLDHPELISEYLATIDTRVGFKSTDRFAAIMQVIAGVICFTPAAVLDLKRAVLAAMAQRQDLLAGCAIIDNTVGQAMGGATPCRMSGTADIGRLLAGKPCPGDHGNRTSLTLADIELQDGSGASTHGGVGQLRGGVGDGAGVGGGDEQLIEIIGSYAAFGDPSLPRIGVKARVDPRTRVLRQLVVWPHAHPGDHRQNSLLGRDAAPPGIEAPPQQQRRRQRQDGDGADEGDGGSRRDEGQGQQQQQSGCAAGGGSSVVQRLRSRSNLQLIPVNVEHNEWAVLFE